MHKTINLKTSICHYFGIKNEMPPNIVEYLQWCIQKSVIFPDA